MPIQIPHDSTLGKELWQWDHREDEVWESLSGERDPSIKGKRPRQPIYYPTMLYKARPNAGGKVVCYEPYPPEYLFLDANQYNRACAEVDVLNRENTKKVFSEEEKARALKEGWRESPPDALAYYEGLQQDIAAAAAENAFAVRRMSEQARAEFADAERSTHAHVVDVKGARKRGRPAKAKPTVIAPSDPEAEA